MKIILVLFLAIFSFQSFSQEKPQEQNSSSKLILYPEVYQVIELDRAQDFQLSILENICEEYNLTLIALENELSIFIKHSSFKTYEKTREKVLKNLNSLLNNTASIKNTQSYGREYLPSHYVKYTVPANLKAISHPVPF